MKKVNISNKKAVKALVVVVSLCVVIGTLISNSLRLLSIAKYSERVKAAASAQTQTVKKNNNNNNSNNGGSYTPVTAVTNNIVPVTETTTSANGGVTSGGLPTTEAPTATEAAKETEAQTEKQTTTEATTKAIVTEEQTTTQTTTEPTTDSAAVKKVKKDVLKKYISVVNSANSIKAGFTKSQYRTCENSNVLAKMFINKLVTNNTDYFISSDSPKVSTVAFGGDRTAFLIPTKYYGCLAKADNASDIFLSAEDKKNTDGSHTLTLVLRDEENPEAIKTNAKKSSSNTASFFDILSEEKIGDMVNSANLTGSYDSLTVTYSGCKLVLTYFPKSGKIVSLTQILCYNAKAVKALSGIDLPRQFNVTDVSEYTDFVYGVN